MSKRLSLLHNAAFTSSKRLRRNVSWTRNLEPRSFLAGSSKSRLTHQSRFGQSWLVELAPPEVGSEGASPSVGRTEEYGADFHLRQILLLCQHQERAQLLRTLLGQRLSSSLTHCNYAPPDSSHLCDCTLIITAWKLWEQSRNFNSVSQLEGFVNKACAELSSLEGTADTRQKKSLEEAEAIFQELIRGVKRISEQLMGP